MLNFFLSIFIFSLSSDAKAEAFLFPEKPATLTECYKAGQAWIEQRMLDFTKDTDDLRFQYNKALAECLWRTQEAKSFIWPVALQSQNDPRVAGNLPGDSLIARTPDGDWVWVKNDDVYSHSTVTDYWWISKKDQSTKIYYGPRLAPYFWGYDFAHYDFGKLGRGFGIQIARASDYGGAVSLHLGLLTTSDQGKGQMQFERDNLRVWRLDDKKNYVYQKCTYQMDPDPKNDRPAVIENCRSREANSAAELKDKKKSRALAEEKKRLRWNGSQLSEQDVSQWLTSYSKTKFSKKSKTKISKKRMVYPEEQLGPVKFRKVNDSFTPEGHEIIGTHEYFEITAGMKPEVVRKIAAKTYLKSAEMFKNIKPEEDAGSSRLTYPYLNSVTKIINVYQDVMAIYCSSASSPPGQRSYDEATYFLFNTATGEEIDWRTSFKSGREYDLFNFWVAGQFGKKISYIFPQQWLPEGTEVPTPMMSGHSFWIPYSDGLELIKGDNSGGHYFENVIGRIRYGLIPRDWPEPHGLLAKIIGDISKNPPAPKESPLLIPKLNCQAPWNKALPEMKICDEKLVFEFDQLLLLSEKVLESKAGNPEALDQVANEHSQFMSGFSNCQPPARACLKQKIEARMQVLGEK